MVRYWRSWLTGLAAVALLTACGPAATQVAVTTSSATSQQRAVAASSGGVQTTAVRSASTIRRTAAPSSVATTPTATQAATAAPARASVRVYFTQGSKLVTETRSVAPANVLRESINALLAGPDQAGHYSQAPTGTRLLDVNLAAGTATLNLSQQVEQLQGSPAIPLFLAQVVNTATQFPTVQHVRLQVNGHPLRSLGGEGFAVPDPLDQATVQRLLDAA